MPEEEFYGMLKICDEFKLIMLEEGFLGEVALRLSDHPLFHLEDQKKLGNGKSLEQVRKTINERHALPLYIQGDRLIGCIQAGHEEDTALAPEILLENLASRASGAIGVEAFNRASGKR